MDWQSLKSRKSAGFARSSTPYAVSYTHEFGIIQAEKPQSLGSKLQRRLWFATAAPANKAVIAGHQADRSFMHNAALAVIKSVLENRQ
jgi:hypothetical protein